jgi:hypothetical protein
MLVRVPVVESRCEEAVRKRLTGMARAFGDILLKFLVGSLFTFRASAFASSVGEATLLAFSTASSTRRLARVISVLLSVRVRRKDELRVKRTLNQGRI